MAVVKDWRGVKIKVGSTVVYPSRQGSHLWMNEAEVVSVDSERIGVRHKDGGRVSYPATNRITVVE